MSVNYIHLAIPVFFLLIGIEVLAARLLEREVYRLNDSINDLSCGILDQVVEVFLKTVLFAGYLFIFERGRLFSIPTPSGRWGDRFRLFWKPPAWHPDDLGGSVGTTEVDRATLVKYDPPAPRGLRLYVLSSSSW